jgi:hypothetical protein
MLEPVPPALLRRLVPEPVVPALRALRRAWWDVRERLSPPDLVEPPRPPLPATPVRLLIGPANFAGQAWEWGRAVERELPGVGAVVLGVERGGPGFPADYQVSLPVYRSLAWQRAQRSWVVQGFTHVLIDAMRPVLGNRRGEDCRHELPGLVAAGLQVGLIAHGSDIRVGARHRELYPWSPWNDPTWEAGRRLEATARRLSAIMAEHDGPTFVSTPDLLDFAPSATWLPVVVPAAPWRSTRPVLERPRPVVLHVPSNPHLKGSHLVDPLLQRMHDAGRISYRRLEGVPSGAMPELVADADIVLDQFVLGLYSVMAVQGLAAGRLVVAHVHDRVRARVPGRLPIVEATPADVVDVLEAVLADRDGYRALAATGPGFAADVHDGRRSAAVLEPFLASRPARADGVAARG